MPNVVSPTGADESGTVVAQGSGLIFILLHLLHFLDNVDKEFNKKWFVSKNEIR